MDSLEQLRHVVDQMAPTPPAMNAYLEKVRERAYTITDSDLEGLKAAGFTEDEIFEQTVTVAVAEGLRRLDAGMRVVER